MDKIIIPEYTKKEEILNFTTHAVGVVLSIIGLLFLNNISSIIFCITLIILYLVSCIYHILPKNNLKKLFRIIDHICVFILEAGTFTPVCLNMIKGNLGLYYVVIIWSITIIFSILNLIDVDKYQKISLIIHLVMGWSVLIMSRLIIKNTSIYIFLLLILGGLIYSLGAIFYKIGSSKKYMHTIFHIFCLFGSLFHYLMIKN